jgi:glycerophosphoryl diester phosphodiesterase
VNAAPLLLAALAVGGLAAIAQAFHPQAGARAAVAAHRGGALLWPENSLLAFRNAAALGADYLELDVHLSRDGEVVVIHDPTLDRTTSGTGPVRDRTVDELRALRLRDRHGMVTAETIPTLDEVIAVAAAARRQLLIEIKVDAGRARYPGIEEKVLAALDRREMAAAAVVMAFEPSTWLRLRELRPALRTGALYSARALEQTGATLSGALEAAGRAGVAFVGLDYTLMTAAAVAQARQSGTALGAWTVNAPHDVRRVIDLGVGVVISDRPDLVRDMLRR